MRTPIRIIPLEPVSLELIDSIVIPLQSVFQTEVFVEKSISNIVDQVYDDSRGQYNSTEIIRKLLEQYENSHSKILGITSVDLFVPVLTYVFGEAQLDGTVCVVSTYRLDNTIYGLEADPLLFFERTLKECVHELGHTIGLYHCKNLDCAMHSSTAVEDIDLKGATLCEVCRGNVPLLLYS